ncbi:DNA-directed RNA polymerase subunit delta [Aliibacillus thermotolerans]|uniref:Probable DNA-directed RNA polymerase subunit delta n=1 Tax=Aliibacillus thermotolerans TaxID=1834418 RepID=A0ABW0U2J5_9BACI|nr:DNA-directed RNA polymerase subunit delta [Aliibacillus thermotolerans]
MKLSDFTQEQIEEMSALELALILLNEKKDAYDFHDLMNRIAELKELKGEELKNRRTKLFTAMNLDGRFVHLGENHWGLREWYPLDQTNEDLSTTITADDLKDAEEEIVDELGDDLLEDEEKDMELDEVEDDFDELSHDEDTDNSIDDLDAPKDL